ncbi:hypothetical protein ACNH6C_15830 [Bdellovibrio bacteriovorus]|uniref:hypothetical protein n=1 Tax=Bdellovibrio bacteriovorus TaxID=959 RepID=UPI003A80F7C0
MKKAVLALSVLLSVSTSFAQNCTVEEAQGIALVSSVEPLNATQCLVQISGIKMFSPSYTCPLSLDEVLVSGVIITCNRVYEGRIDGIFYRDNSKNDSNIYLY